MARWVSLKVERAAALSVMNGRLAVSSSQGKVRFFHCKDLRYIATLPRPAKITGATSAKSQYPDAVMCRMMDDGNRTVVVYSNGNMIVWDTHDTTTVRRVRTAASHRDAVWGLRVWKGDGVTLPAQTLISASADGSIRVWDAADASGACRILRSAAASVATDSDDGALATASSSALRCMALSVDGQHLAAGDREGNVHVFALTTGECITILEAHDAEVTAMDYSQPIDESGECLLATASR